MPRVLVGIATYKRPIMLEAALRRLARLETKADVWVLVADNSHAGEGVAVVQRLAMGGYRFPISAMMVRQRGIPQVRNAIVAAMLNDAGTELLAFMDDDQLPEPQWLDALIAMHEETGADVVGSAVYPKFEVEPAAWVHGTLLFRPDLTTDGVVDVVLGTGGVLINREAFSERAQPWFDPALALTGGSDSDFFHRLRADGGSFARARASVIHEVFSGGRISLRWILRRGYRTGASDLRIALKLHPSWQTRLVEAMRIGGILIAVPLLLVVGIGRPTQQADALFRFARALGKISALFGRRYEEYATVHGN